MPIAEGSDDVGLSATSVAVAAWRASTTLQSAALPIHPYLAGLVQRLFAPSDAATRKLRSVMFVGVDATEDSALLPAAVAEMTALTVGGRVCLLDGDLESPALHDTYGLANGSGLSELLQQSHRPGYYHCVFQKHDRSLWLLTAGSSPIEESGALASITIRRRLRELKTAFDTIVIAAPPISEQSPTAGFAPAVDGVVLVATAGVTRRETLHDAAGELRASGAQLVGTVLCERTFPIPETVYRLL